MLNHGFRRCRLISWGLFLEKVCHEPSNMVIELELSVLIFLYACRRESHLPKECCHLQEFLCTFLLRDSWKPWKHPKLPCFMVSTKQANKDLFFQHIRSAHRNCFPLRCGYCVFFGQDYYQLRHHIRKKHDTSKYHIIDMSRLLAGNAI